MLPRPAPGATNWLSWNSTRKLPTRECCRARKPPNRTRVTCWMEASHDAGGRVVRLNSLVLQNFRQHAFTRIDFDAGITGIIGDNGSGKTTILEAVAWALYGQSAARGTRDSIKHNRA